MDLENGKLTFNGTIDKYHAQALNYTITEGKLLDIPVYGHGRYSITLGEYHSVQ